MDDCELLLGGLAGVCGDSVFDIDGEEESELGECDGGEG